MRKKTEKRELAKYALMIIKSEVKDCEKNYFIYACVGYDLECGFSEWL